MDRFFGVTGFTVYSIGDFFYKLCLSRDQKERLHDWYDEKLGMVQNSLCIGCRKVGVWMLNKGTKLVSKMKRVKNWILCCFGQRRGSYDLVTITI